MFNFCRGLCHQINSYVSKKIVIALDTSHSMHRDEHSNGNTKIDVARFFITELLKVLSVKDKV